MNQRKKQPHQTRQTILDAAGAEFSLRGYTGAGLGGIVARAELTKGALFHHFSDKRTLAMAWIGERLGEEMLRLWVTPLQPAHSLDDLRDLCRVRCREMHAEEATSALVAIAAEVAACDEMLAGALDAVFRLWREAVVGFFERGKAAGWIHPSIKPESEAALLVSAFSGFTVAVKCAATPESRAAFLSGIEGYLETLRVATH